MKLREWSGKNTNLTVDQEDIYVGYRAAIAAMSAERGMEYVSYQDQAVNADDFIQYIRELRAKQGTQPLALFLDQLPVHKSRHLHDWWQKLNIIPVFNVGYSPQFNPIEAVFSKVKFLFARTRLNDLVNKKGFNMDRTIELAFKAVSAEHCSACVRKSYFLLERSA